MNEAEMQRALDDVFDQALVFHAFTDYSRDYEIITWSVGDPKAGIAPSFDRYLFQHCVEATVTTALTPETWRKSVDDSLIDFENRKHPDGDVYVWGVKYQVLYPGARVTGVASRHHDAGGRGDRHVNEPASAKEWERAVGIQFHEAVVETNVQKIVLIFSDLVVSRLETGYSPFVVAAQNAVDRTM